MATAACAWVGGWGCKCVCARGGGGALCYGHGAPTDTSTRAHSGSHTLHAHMRGATTVTPRERARGRHWTHAHPNAAVAPARVKLPLNRNHDAQVLRSRRDSDLQWPLMEAHSGLRAPEASRRPPRPRRCGSCAFGNAYAASAFMHTQKSQAPSETHFRLHGAAAGTRKRCRRAECANANVQCHHMRDCTRPCRARARTRSFRCLCAPRGPQTQCASLPCPDTYVHTHADAQMQTAPAYGDVCRHARAAFTRAPRSDMHTPAYTNAYHRARAAAFGNTLLQRRRVRECISPCARAYRPPCASFATRNAAAPGVVSNGYLCPVT